MRTQIIIKDSVSGFERAINTTDHGESFFDRLKNGYAYPLEGLFEVSVLETTTIDKQPEE